MSRVDAHLDQHGEDADDACTIVRHGKSHILTISSSSGVRRRSTNWEIAISR